MKRSNKYRLNVCNYLRNYTM